ncbi:hypothetical protein SKAU_G00207900 [Synaphobranchus kaupii]|uniref:Uncharacterized protein n=1 Tax=Synaphobranchus kaupii TaxID=118154 RepID=A0A9Q1IUR0_SYNKA|nr:hypothetical protein SKAU_G00207900 [Synaphobranchus kaupii]
MAQKAGPFFPGKNGGDYNDRTELLGEYLQFGKYKGKSFKWLLENDVGYTIYLSRRVDKETTADTFTAEGHSKDSLLSFLEYAHSFQEIQNLLAYEGKKQAPPVTVASVGDNLVGFGQRALSTWKEVWESRATRILSWQRNVLLEDAQKMHKLQQFLLLQQRQQEVATATVVESTRSAQGSQLVMDDDEELRACHPPSLRLSHVQYQPQSQELQLHLQAERESCCVKQLLKECAEPSHIDGVQTRRHFCKCACLFLTCFPCNLHQESAHSPCIKNRRP